MAITDLLEKAKSSLSDGPDLDEYEAEVPDDISELAPVVLDPDPKPRRTAASKAAGAGRGAPRITAAQRRQVKDNLDLLVSLICLGWGFRDDYCPVTLSEHQEQIIEKAIPVIMRSPSLMEYLVGKEAKFLDIIALASAVAPVGKTMAQHHLTKSIGHDQESNTTDEQQHDHSRHYPAPRYS